MLGAAAEVALYYRGTTRGWVLRFQRSRSAISLSGRASKHGTCSVQGRRSSGYGCSNGQTENRCCHSHRVLGYAGIEPKQLVDDKRGYRKVDCASPARRGTSPITPLRDNYPNGHRGNSNDCMLLCLIGPSSSQVQSRGCLSLCQSPRAPWSARREAPSGPVCADGELDRKVSVRGGSAPPGL